MNKKILIVTILIVLFTFGYFVIKNSKKNSQLLNPNSKKAESVVVPSIMPSATPKNYKFDRNTDLKNELDTINPKVLDSDFE